MDKKNLVFIVLLLLILIIIFSLLIVTIADKFKNNDKSSKKEVISIQTTDEQKNEINEEVKKTRKEILDESTEQKRIEQYATEFIRFLEGRHISSAYSKLNEDFKKNYFNNQEAFKEYIDNYFPKETSTKYKNLERLGDIYILEVDIKDILSKNPNNFSFYIVIKENDYDDYEISFSVDKPMKKNESKDNK